jgi:hypothetical protein
MTFYAELVLAKFDPVSNFVSKENSTFIPNYVRGK